LPVGQAAQRRGGKNAAIITKVSLGGIAKGVSEYRRYGISDNRQILDGWWAVPPDGPDDGIQGIPRPH
jgi:hypothetical protein